MDHSFAQRIGKASTAILVACATTLLLLVMAPAPSHAGVDDFSYELWDVHYELSAGAGGHSVARVTESVVALFPDFDQNRGIVRALPLRYEGAPAAPEQITVTDADGTPVPFEVENDDTFRAILVGDNRYVHGRQTYVISYTLHNVILATTETLVDEFYWDVVPHSRRQIIESATGSFVFDSSLAPELTGAATCYAGTAYSNDQCALRTQADADTTTVSFGPEKLERGEGVSVAIALAPGTVTQPPERLPSFALDVLPAGLAGAGLVLGGVGIFLRQKLKRTRRTYRGTIVAQYDVPPYLPPLIAGPLAQAPKAPLAAEFVHLAVQGAMVIEEDPNDTTGFFVKTQGPQFRLVKASRGKDPLDRMMLGALFAPLAPGTRFPLPRNSTVFGEKMQKIQAAGVKAATDRGYFTKERDPLARVLGFVGLGSIPIIVILLVLGSSRDTGAGLPLAIILGLGTLVLSLANISQHRVYTPLGAESYEYLKGVREFIRVAEADRIRVLQSHEGAERLASGEVDVVHLYEKLLPYAMLFGLEKQWGKVLEVRYHESGSISPVWYPALASQGFTGLDSSLATLTSSLSSSAGYTSSSSGGSSGGGFSGGGGGGGFSGGR